MKQLVYATFQIIKQDKKNFGIIAFLDFLLAMPLVLVEIKGFDIASTPGFITAMISFIFQAWLQVGLIKLLSDKWHNIQSETSLKMALSWALIRLPSFILYLLIYYILLVGGFFLLIIPGVMAAIYFVFAPYCALFEERWGPLNFARTLVKGHVLQVMLTLLFILVLDSVSLVAEFLSEPDISLRMLKLALLGMGAFTNLFSTGLIVILFWKIYSTQTKNQTTSA